MGKSKNKNKKNKSYKSIISAALVSFGRKGATAKELASYCRVKKGDKKRFLKELYEYADTGVVVEYRKRWYLAKAIGAFTAEVVRLNKTYGFVRRISDGSEFFVAGKYLMGAVCGDEVIVKPISSIKGPEGQIIGIIKENKDAFTGVVSIRNGAAFIIPDKLSDFPIPLRGDTSELYDRDKVVAEIVKRGKDHRSHIARVLSISGSSDSASDCADAILEAAGIPVSFPGAVYDEAYRIEKMGIPESEKMGREDFTKKRIFTIDGEESKDLDDAVSLEFKDDKYILGVHIADVSHYVRPGSLLDAEAFQRGTSIYFADRVVPMLPKQLSNGICSLNPKEERLTFSAIITLDKNGELLDFEFKKSIIKSVVRGVYSEVNAILNGSATEEIKEKYKEVLEDIKLMDALTERLVEKRRQRKAPEIETSESKIITKDGVAVDVKARQRGRSEIIIEEFMLMANRCAAIFARENQLPFVYRIHEQPPEDKITALKAALAALGLPASEISEGKSPSELFEVLSRAKNLPIYTSVSRMVVRSMAKASYSDIPKAHYGLALEDYAHFTSPIRRYPDLSIHRIMSDYLKEPQIGKIIKRYSTFSKESAKRSSITELEAAMIERECEDCYKAEYMQNHVGEVFEATVSGVTSFGFFAELENTVEGLVSLSDMPEGNYVLVDGVRLTDTVSGKSVSLGDRVKVKCVKADINSGRIDFVPADE